MTQENEKQIQKYKERILGIKIFNSILDNKRNILSLSLFSFWLPISVMMLELSTNLIKIPLFSIFCSVIYVILLLKLNNEYKEILRLIEELKTYRRVKNG